MPGGFVLRFPSTPPAVVSEPQGPNRKSFTYCKFTITEIRIAIHRPALFLISSAYGNRYSVSALGEQEEVRGGNCGGSRQIWNWRMICEVSYLQVQGNSPAH